MTALAAALVIHVLSVVWWIGGLAFVTAVILPALRSGRAGDAHAIFELIESRFAPQARIAVLPAGLLGRLARHGGDQRRWLLMQRVHLALLLVALAIVAGAVAGSHGF